MTSPILEFTRPIGAYALILHFQLPPLTGQQFYFIYVLVVTYLTAFPVPE